MNLTQKELTKHEQSRMTLTMYFTFDNIYQAFIHKIINIHRSQLF